MKDSGLILVDTSVFIEFLRGNSKESIRDFFREALLNDRIAISDFVKLELLSGVKISEQQKLHELLGGLQSVPLSSELMSIAETSLLMVKKVGINYGMIDYLIVIQAKQSGMRICSIDKVLNRIASIMEVEKIPL